MEEFHLIVNGGNYHWVVNSIEWGYKSIFTTVAGISVGFFNAHWMFSLFFTQNQLFILLLKWAHNN